MWTQHTIETTRGMFEYFTKEQIVCFLKEVDLVKKIKI